MLTSPAIGTADDDHLGQVVVFRRFHPEEPLNFQETPRTGAACAVRLRGVCFFYYFICTLSGSKR